MLNFPDAPTVGLIFSDVSAWVWDGVKWNGAGTGSGAGGPINVLTPVSGATVTLTDYRPVLINNAATLALLTIRLPPAPTTTSFIEISFSHPVIVLSVADSAGVVFPTAPTSAYGPGAALLFRYTGAIWQYWK